MTTVSVIIPCYRDSKTLGRAIASVCAQSRRVEEIVVVNDCSPETTEIEQVLSEYPLVVYVRNAINLGLAASRNVGIATSTGEIVSFLDADDELHPQKIEFQLSLLREGSAVACGVRLIRGGERLNVFPEYSRIGEVRTVTSDRRFLFKNALTGASLMASKELLLRFGGYDEALRSCEDFDLWLRLIEQGVTIFELKMPLYYYHFNPAGLSKNLQNISQWEIEVLERHFSRKGNNAPPQLLQSIAGAVWLCKHFVRAEIAGDRILRERTLENVPRVIVEPFLAKLIGAMGRTRVFLPYGRLRRITEVTRRKWQRAS